jgi:hypothetical protein
MARYESELTGFLRQLKQQDPELENKQREARALWWDRKSDQEDVERWERAAPARGSYVYYTFGKKGG